MDNKHVHKQETKATTTDLDEKQPSNFGNNDKNPKTKNNENKETDYNNMRKICENCGKENDKESNKCKYCYFNLNNNISIKTIKKNHNSNTIKQKMVCIALYCINVTLNVFQFVCYIIIYFINRNQMMI